MSNHHKSSDIFRKGINLTIIATFEQNDRAKYVDVFMNHLVSWEAAAARLTWAEALVNLGEPKIPIA